MKHRVISDTHFGHELLVNLWDRKKWYEYKIDRSLKKLTKDDVLIHLWDICIGNDQEVHDTYIKPLQCRKILVKGNHDRKSDSRYLDNGWDMVVESMVINMFGKKILFQHIPGYDTEDWVEQSEDRLVMHWHRHTFGRRNEHPVEWHILFSCEYQNMQARTVKYMLWEGKDRIIYRCTWCNKIICDCQKDFCMDCWMKNNDADTWYNICESCRISVAI